jgi:8-amino-7-oxononanoate synthase
MSHFPKKLLAKLDKRKAEHNFRELSVPSAKTVDFFSNDYLGFSSNRELKKLRDKIVKQYQVQREGSTGARLLSGNTKIAQACEKLIAKFHHAPGALLFNSGYNANVGLLSAVPLRGDLVLYDELCHASIIDGMRMSFADNYKFRHNNTAHLGRLLQRHSGSQFPSESGDTRHIYVVTESVFSMDGDHAPLKEIAELCKKYKAFLIVDEAHATGLFGKQGRGLCNELKIEEDCFARVYTFGKALGVHGAAVAGSKALMDYLVNFARSFVYTTALPPASVAAVMAAYSTLQKSKEIKALQSNIKLFNKFSVDTTNKIKSHSAVHCFLVPGNDYAIQAAETLQKKGYEVRAIKSPTVKEGSERLRVCLHAFNTAKELEGLSRELQKLFS